MIVSREIRAGPKKLKILPRMLAAKKRGIANGINQVGHGDRRM